MNVCPRTCLLTSLSLPIHWLYSCITTMAHAEIISAEHVTHDCPSDFTGFRCELQLKIKDVLGRGHWLWCKVECRDGHISWTAELACRSSLTRIKQHCEQDLGRMRRNRGRCGRLGWCQQVHVYLQYSSTAWTDDCLIRTVRMITESKKVAS